MFVALVVKLNAQTDWDCNHYEAFPTDSCISFATFSFAYECNKTDSLIQNIYLGGDCSGIAIFSATVNDSSAYQCDQMKSCDSVGISVYNDSDCTDYVIGLAYVIGQCSSSANGTSYKTDCSDTEMVSQYYFFSENCTGPSLIYQVDLSDLEDGECYEVCVEKKTTTRKRKRKRRIKAFFLF